MVVMQPNIDVKKTYESYSIYGFSSDRFEICYKLSSKQKIVHSKHSWESGLQTSMKTTKLVNLTELMSIKSS